MSVDDAPDSAAQVDPAILIDFAERKQDLADRVAQAKRDDAKLRDDEAGILAMLSHAGVPRMTVETKYGNRTIGFRRSVFSSKKEGVTTEEVVAVLDALDLEDFHKESITLQSINSWLREQYEANEPIPEELKAVLNTDPSFRVGVTK